MKGLSFTQLFMLNSGGDLMDVVCSSPHLLLVNMRYLDDELRSINEVVAFP